MTQQTLLKVFANAALDFVSCLIHHVRGSEERRQVEELITKEEMDAIAKMGPGGGDSSPGQELFVSSDTALTRAALRMLAQCSEILAKMYRMTNCPTFQVRSLYSRVTSKEEGSMNVFS